MQASNAYRDSHMLEGKSKQDGLLWTAAPTVHTAPPSPCWYGMARKDLQIAIPFQAVADEWNLFRVSRCAIEWA